jgi:hypothetical protein
MWRRPGLAQLQHEALDQIAVKIARILAGDPGCAACAMAAVPAKVAGVFSARAVGK